MRSYGELIRKEKLRSNFKLVFDKDKKTFFAFLYGEEKRIFNNLRIGINYSFFTWKKQGHKYFSIKPKSIKEFRQVSFKPVKKINTRNIFISKIGKSLKLTNMSEEVIRAKITDLRNKRLETYKWEDKAFLKHVREIIFALFINRELSPLTQFSDNQAEQFLQDLENIFVNGKLLG